MRKQTGEVAALVAKKTTCPGERHFSSMLMTQKILRAVLGAAVVAGAAGAEPAVGTWSVEWGPAWTVRGDFSKGKDLSAAAAFGPSQGLVASDETRAAQRISFDAAARVVTVHELLPLLPGKGAELDLEGAAASIGERGYFLIGSQALSRKKEAFEADRGYVFKLPVDDAHRPQPGAVAKADLRAVLAADAELAPFLNRPAEENGLDIEGLAERDGVLFLGLRAPERDGKAMILEVGIKALFAGTATLGTHRVALGPGRGVRDLVALAGKAGFLLLSGPSGGPGSGPSQTGATYELWHWPGPGSAAARLGALGTVSGEAEAKAEAILILSQSESAIEGVVFHDGPKNGAPHGFRLSPPPTQ